MLYEKYQNAAMKVASVIQIIKRFRVLILSVLGAILVSTSAAMAVNGVIYDVTPCPEVVAYGEELTYQAKAIFEDFYYEYATLGSSEWTSEQPRLAGSYQVRAVSKRTFGSISYGDTHSFVIAPKQVTVSVDQTKIQYGDTPTVTADLVEGDQIYCSQMSYRDLGNKTVSKVTPVASAITVYDKNGQDVTSSYAFSTMETDVSFGLRTVEISIAGIEDIYNGAPYQTDEYEITDGTLAFEDTLSLNFEKTLTNVGAVQNTAKITALTKDGVDVTHHYYFLIKCGDLIVNKRPITLVTQSAKLTYDGTERTAYSCEAKEEENVSWGLAKGHILVRNEEVNTTLKEVGTAENVLEYFIYDADGNDVTENYDISYEYGTLEVSPRPLKVQTGSESWTYDGKAHSHSGFDYAEDNEYEVVEGQEWKIDGGIPSVKYVLENAVTTKNEFSIKILEGETDVSGNYDISYEYGEISITPLSVTFKAADEVREYEGIALTGQKYTVAPELAEGDIPTVTFTGTATNVGTIDSFLAVGKIENGTLDVTLCYTIACEKGSLKIIPREIVVTTEGKEFIYDGEEHSHPYATADRLVEKHTLDAKEGYTTIVNVGETDNVFEVEIKDADKNDVTGNYKILEYRYGKLIVKPRPITLVTESEQFIYNGKENAAYSCEVKEQENVSWSLVQGHELVRNKEVNTTLKAVDTVKNVLEYFVHDADGNDVTENYDISYEYGTLEVLPRPLKVQTGSESWTYDGKAHSHSGFDYAEDNEYEVVEGQEWKIDGDIPSVKYVLENAATTKNEFTVAIFEGETDVSENYDISYVYGDIFITPLSVTFKAADEVFEYEGIALTGSEYTVTPALIEGDIPTVTFTGTGTNVGTFDNVLTVEKIENGTVDVTLCYAIACEKGTLEITPREIIVDTETKEFIYDGEEHSHPYAAADRLVKKHTLNAKDGYTTIVKVGERDNVFEVEIKDADGNDVTGNYKVLEYRYGKLIVKPRPILLVAQSAEKIYDGTPLTAKGYIVAERENISVSLLKDHTIVNVPDALGEITDVGVVVNTLLVDFATLNVIDGQGNDVTDCYEFIGTEEGWLTVLPRPIVVKTGSYTWVYDDEEHFYIEETKVPDELENENDGLVLDHYIYIVYYQSILEVGMVENVQYVLIFNEEGKELTYNYEISYDYGELEITPRPITIKTGNGKWVYDDEYHFNTDDTDVVEKGIPDCGLVAWHRFEITYYAEIQYIGKVLNQQFIEIYSEDGRYVTYNYDISYEYGVLEITPRPITIKTGDGTWIYDDEDHFNTEDTHVVKMEIPDYGLVEGHEYVITFYTSIRDAYTALNDQFIGIWSADARDVTNNYAITYDYGTLVITPRKLTLTTGSGQWTYDGLEHYNYQDTKLLPNEKGLPDYGLVEGHEYVITFYTSIRDAYTVVNEQFIGIWSADARDVTHNYAITYEYGTLVITPRKLTFTTGSGQWTYDGLEHCNYQDTKLLPNEEGLPDYGLVQGQRYEIAEYATIKFVGQTFNYHSFAFYAEDGSEVWSGNYEITTYMGELIVAPAPLYIYTGGAEKIYDGLPLTNETYEVSDENLAPGDTITKKNIVTNGSQTEIGYSWNTIDFETFVLKIENAEGEDVTGCYALEFGYGELIVTPRSISITTDSKQKIYDGTPLTAEEYSLSGDGLLPTHSFAEELYACGSQTEVGMSPNVLNKQAADIRIVDENGYDVSEYYSILVKLGYLRVVDEDGPIGGGGGGSGEGEGEGEGGSGGGLLGLSGSLGGTNKPGGDHGENTPIFSFKVEQNGRVYFRIKSYGDFTYNSWAEAPIYKGDDLTVNPLYFVALALADAGYDLTTITIKDLYGGTHWMLPYFADKNSDESLNDVMIENGKWDEYTLSMYVYEYMINDGVTLQGTAYEEMEENYRKFVYENYLDLPSTTKAAMQRQIQRAGFDADSPTIIYDVANYIRGYLPYDLYCPEYEGDYAIYFFEQAKSALCRYYSTAATAIYRTLGIPARYVVGYVGYGEKGIANVVTADKGHAWVEVYIDGLGWMPVEVTGAGEGSAGGGSVMGGGGGGGGFGDMEERFQITLKPLTISQRFDPKNPTVYAKNKLEAIYIQDLLDKGYTYEVFVNGSKTGVGFAESEVVKGSFKLFDKYGTDVTDKCDLEYETGTITVYSDFVVEIFPFTFTYDGQMHRYSDYEALGVKWYQIICPEGYEISFDASHIGMTDVGILNMKAFYELSVTVTYNGVVMTGEEYTVAFVGEPMRITQRTIEISSGSATAEYTHDIVLKNETVVITKGNLAEGHTLQVSAIGVQTTVGESLNKIGKCVILDENGNDVTDNYNIIPHLGQLKILESPE